jgi:hypothetical protein
MEANLLHILSWVMVLLGLGCSAFVAGDLGQRQPQPMAVMRYVWPINALWGGIFGIWAYWAIGRMPALATGPAPSPHDAGGDKAMSPEGPVRPFWQSVVAGTFHCGAGCSLADLIGPFVFRLLPFVVAGSLVFGEWTLDYILALIVGVAFQYAALSPMLGKTGLPVWWRALKVDFFSLTAWQVGMYGWMALVIFVWLGELRPWHIEFWFMMQLAMAWGFLTSYPMNWLLIRIGIKTAM